MGAEQQILDDERASGYLTGIANTLEDYAANIRSHAERFELADLEDQHARDLYVGMVAHELRTPVVALRSRIELLAQRTTDPDTLKTIGELLESCDDLVQISSDLLDFQKIRAGAFSLHPSPFLPSALLKRVTDDQNAVAISVGTTFHVVNKGKTKEWRLGDRHRLLQVLSNVLGNAHKFSSGGTVDLTSDFSDASNVTFTVTDSGPGLTDDELAIIFQPYKQAQSTEQIVKSGTGLGLTVVQSLVDLMQGEITVKSTLGKGTSFSIVVPMPACAAPDFDQPGTYSITDNRSPDLKGRSILHVEDDLLQGDLIREFLRPTHVRLYQCHSIEEALDILRRRKVDGVVTDMYLPDGTGLEVLGYFQKQTRRRHQEDALTMLISAAIPDHQSEQVQQLNITHVHIKPLRRRDLMEFLEVWAKDKNA